MDEAALDGRLERECDVLALRQGQRLRHQRAQELAEVVLADAQPQLRLLELGEVEEVADHPQELHAAAKHHVQRRPLRRRQVHRFLQQELQRRQDHRQRGFQLVGDVGEELRLELVEALELLVRLLQAGLGPLDQELVDQLLALGAIAQDLAAGDDDGRRHQEEEVRNDHHQGAVPGERDVGQHERGDDQGVREQHHPRRPDEEKAGGDDDERQAGVVRRGEAAHEHRHAADADGAEDQEPGADLIGEAFEDLGAEQPPDDDGGDRHQDPRGEQVGQRFARRNQVVEDEEGGVEDSDEHQRARAAAVAGQEPRPPATLDVLLLLPLVRRQHQSLWMAMNGLMPVGSSTISQRASGAATRAMSVISARVR